MEKIFQTANEKNVKSFVVYGKSADSKLYYEPEFKTQVTELDMFTAFTKGMLVVKAGDAYLAPLAVNANKVTTADMSGSPAAITGTQWAAKATPAS